VHAQQGLQLLHLKQLLLLVLGAHLRKLRLGLRHWLQAEELVQLWLCRLRLWWGRWRLQRRHTHGAHWKLRRSCGRLRQAAPSLLLVHWE
jgi:hypothetical protein